LETIPATCTIVTVELSSLTTSLIENTITQSLFY
jgi:hypothetical protein